MKAADRLHGIGEYYFSQKLREIDLLQRSGSDIINLGIGNPDLPPAALVINTLHKESSRTDTHGYQSYKGIMALRLAIAEWYGQWYQVSLNPENEILPLIGSKEGIMHICMAFLNYGDKVLIPNPGYPTYRSAVMVAGAQPVEYRLSEQNNWLPDFDAIERFGLDGVKMMFVNYPHMPTGQLPVNNVFEKVVSFAQKHNILVVHDNPYSFILNDKPKSILSVPGAFEVAIELNSLSKSHNMAGWRVGMLCGRQELINEVLRFKSNVDSGMFLPVQMAAAIALSLDEDWFRSLNEEYLARREKVFELLNALQCQFSTTQAGLFVWARIPSSYKDSFHFSDELLQQHGIFVAPGGIFGSEGLNYVRVSLCARREVFKSAIQKIKRGEMQA